MTDTLARDLDELVGALTDEGYAFVHGADMRRMLEVGDALQDWPAFARSWDTLGPDSYLALKGPRRRRRHGVFRIDAAGEAMREAHQAHYQNRRDNPLQGGIERWFEPLQDAACGASLARIIAFGRDLFARLATDAPTWRVEVHQFRIEARPGEAGEPTPEGMHHDGVDYVLVLMIERRNIESGTTSIHGEDGRELGAFTLAAPFDAALVDDPRVRHGVTPVMPKDPALPAHRDVLVVTYRRTDRGGEAAAR